MNRVIIAATTIALSSPVLFAAAQPAKEPYAPGLGEFMTATQLRHAKLWFAGRAKNWELAGYEIDEIKEGLEEAAKQFPTRDGIPVADMIKANIDPALGELEMAVEAKNSAKFAAAFDDLTKACNTCHAGAKKEFIRIQRPTAPPVSNQNFAPGK
ncbi:MAG TPA: hypothetical protein VKC66_30425 [Xanthobacteraceae bacterium]|nr:hypothetical protein [Xanthobacteraceae bacterium]